MNHQPWDQSWMVCQLLLAEQILRHFLKRNEQHISANEFDFVSHPVEMLEKIYFFFSDKPGLPTLILHWTFNVLKIS